MAWKTRHIKVPALNDSQHIGICIYSAVFTTIIVILSSFISNYFIFTYIAKSVCILASTTLTLLLLSLPKLKLVFRKIDCEDPITQSMGLKIESNTRRFITDDTKEMIYRLEIQNRVYKCEVAALDKEIARLEDLLHSSTTCSTKSSVNAITIAADCHLSVPNPSVSRASWPCTHGQLKMSGSTFRSENKLSYDLFEKIKCLGKLKKYFTSFSTLYSSNQQISECKEDVFKIVNDGKRKNTHLVQQFSNKCGNQQFPVS